MTSRYPQTLLALLGLAAVAAQAQTAGTWNVDAAGNWSTVGSWTGLTNGLVPNAIDANVTFGPIVTAGRTVTLDTDVTVGSLIFNEDAVNANSYGITFNNSSRTMTFDVSSGNATVAVRGAGGYQLGTQGAGQVILNDNLAISAGSSGAATSEGGNFNINSQIIDGNAGPRGLILSSLNSNDGSGTAVNGARGTNLRSTVANTFSGGVTVNSGYFGLVANIGNAGTGAITLNSSDPSNGGAGTSLNLKTGGGTLTNDIVFGSVYAGGGNGLGITLNDTGSYIFSGTVTGSTAGNSVRFNGNTGTLTLSGNASALTTTSSNFHVRSGTLVLNAANAWGANNTPGSGWALGSFSNGATSTAQLLTNGFNVGGNLNATQTATGTGQSSSDTIVIGGQHATGSATFSGNLTIGRIVGGTRQVQLTSATGGTTVFSGVIADGSSGTFNTTAVPVFKVGGGIVNFTNANTYTGGTTVSAGTLLVNNATGSGTGTGNVNVGAAGALGGNGTISGSVSFTAGASFVFSLTDALTVNGASVTFGGFGMANVSGLTNAVADGIYTLIDGSASVSATNLANIGSGNAYDLGGGKSAYFELGNGDFQVVVSSIPEPSTFVTFAGLCVLGFAARRRRAA